MITSGYHTNKAQSREAFRDGWYRTGDIVKADGPFIYVLGRAQVNINVDSPHCSPQLMRDAQRMRSNTTPSRYIRKSLSFSCFNWIQLPMQQCLASLSMREQQQHARHELFLYSSQDWIQTRRFSMASKVTSPQKSRTTSVCEGAFILFRLYQEKSRVR